MRRAAWAFFAINAIGALGELLLATSAAAAQPAASVWELDQAQYLQTPLEAPGETRAAWQVAPPTLTAPAGPWQPVTLPHSSRLQATADAPLRQFQTSQLHWYRFELPPATLQQLVPTLYLPRLHLQGTLNVYLDGRRQSLSGPGQLVHFNRPLLLALTPSRPMDRPAELLLRIEAAPDRLHALAAPQVGDGLVLRERQQVREWLQIEGPRVASACLLLLGLFALLVGLRRRHEPQHLWFFALTLLFFLRCIHYHSDVPWSDTSSGGRWFAWMTINTLAWITVVTVRVAAAFHGLQQPRGERWLWGMATFVTLVTLPWVGQWLPALSLGPLVYPLHMALTVLAIGLLASAARRSGSGHTAALAAVLLLNLLLGVHDWLLRLALIPVDGFYLLPYGGLAMFGVVLHAMASGYSRALVQAEQSAVVLDHRLAEREAELRDSHERLRHIEREQVLADERQRLMREMHDGLGSTLASTLVAVQRGQLPPDGVAQMLRESVDDLRLTLDSLDPAAGQEPLLLLATLRYRLAPRLEAAGITLDWRLHELPELPPLGPATALHLLRMLQEALANVVKHAQASRVTVTSETTADALVLVVADNGRGFDTTQPPTGRGLLNLRRRAESMGGRVELDSSAQGSTLRIVLPR